jgi:hypothetical protein
MPGQEMPGGFAIGLAFFVEAMLTNWKITLAFLAGAAGVLFGIVKAFRYWVRPAKPGGDATS